MKTLKQIKQSVGVPVYAIGGLNAGNVAAVKPAGVDGVAVVSAIMRVADPQRAARELRDQVLTIIG